MFPNPGFWVLLTRSLTLNTTRSTRLRLHRCICKFNSSFKKWNTIITSITQWLPSVWVALPWWGSNVKASLSSSVDWFLTRGLVEDTFCAECWWPRNTNEHDKKSCQGSWNYQINLHIWCVPSFVCWSRRNLISMVIILINLININTFPYIRVNIDCNNAFIARRNNLNLHVSAL